MSSAKKKRIVLAKPGLDAHEIGIKLVARALMNAGAEVVYLGKYQTAEGIVTSALQEDADIIGLSFLGGDHLIHTARVLELLKTSGAHIPVIVGGVIPPQDVGKLRDMGIEGVFSSGTQVKDMEEFVLK